MTELERYQPRDVVDGWVQMLPAVGDLAVKIASTEFVPTQLRGKPAAVAAAILAGRELGLAPLQSLQHVAIVQGRPSLSAEMCRALVVAAGHEIFFPERTTTRCVIRGRRRGQQEWTEVAFSMDDARRARLDAKDNWKHYPRRMLDARATSELCHLIFPDVVGGIAVTEEAEDDRPAIADGEVVVVEPPRRTAQRRTLPKTRPAAADPIPPPPADPTPENLPPLPGEPGYEDPEPIVAHVRRATHAGEVERGDQWHPQPGPHADGYTDAVEGAAAVDRPITDPQMRKLQTVFTKHGIRARGDRLLTASQLAGRDIDSAKDLTAAEASVVIDTLERVNAIAGEEFGDFLSRLYAAIASAGGIVADIDPDTGEVLDQPALDEETE